MNNNFFRTIMGLLTGGGLVTLIAMLAGWLGCTVDDPATAAVEATSCAGSTILSSISPFATAIGTAVFLAIGAIAKTMKPGTVKENLTAPSVPVVPAADARPGVVTKAQVEASSSGKK